MCDARDAGVEIFTLGQYLQPTPSHLPVTEFVPPEKFEHWAKFGMEEIGFRWGPGEGGCCLAQGLGSAGLSGAVQACDCSGHRMLSPSPLCSYPTTTNTPPPQNRYVASGPMVRSSYKAGEVFVESMIQQDRGIAPSH
jgi:hypothetical protein